MMTGPDEQMDHYRGSYEPVNPLPIKCPHCTFPNLDFIPEPYLLSKGVSSPAETSNAHFGNFLVRDRVKRILELAVPDACTFHPTAELKGKKPAPWRLAVPVNILETIVPAPNPPFCSQCHEPKTWAYAKAEPWSQMCHFNSAGVDVFKSLAWYTRHTVEDAFASANLYCKEKGLPPPSWPFRGVEAPTHPERWTRRMLERELYFSVRLEQLFKRAKVKGRLVRLLSFDEVKPSPEDEAWVREKLQILAEAGLTEETQASKGKNNNADTWFKRFMKRNTKQGLKSPDFAILEQKHKITLPQDYKDFISTAGPKKFKDICEMEGSTTTILMPQKLDFKNYRKGKVPFLEDKDADIDGVMFAEIDNGDCFVFDVSSNVKDFPVYWYRHEENTMEPFSPNFAECIKRFVQCN